MLLRSRWIQVITSIHSKLTRLHLLINQFLHFKLHNLILSIMVHLRVINSIATTHLWQCNLRTIISITVTTSKWINNQINSKTVSNQTLSMEELPLSRIIIIRFKQHQIIDLWWGALVLKHHQWIIHLTITPSNKMVHPLLSRILLIQVVIHLWNNNRWIINPREIHSWDKAIPLHNIHQVIIIWIREATPIKEGFL